MKQTEHVMRTGVRGFHQGTRAYSPSTRCRIYDCNLSFMDTAIFPLQCGADHICINATQSVRMAASYGSVREQDRRPSFGAQAPWGDRRGAAGKSPQINVFEFSGPTAKGAKKTKEQAYRRLSPVR